MNHGEFVRWCRIPVMIHSPYAPLANSAVVSSRRSEGLAASANSPLVVVEFVLVGVEVGKVKSGGWKRHGSGIEEYCFEVCHH